MRDRKPLEFPVGVEHVNRAPVRDEGNGQLRDRAQRRLVIQRAAERDAGLGQKVRLVVRAFGLLPLSELVFIELGRRDRYGRKVPECGSHLRSNLVEALRGPVIEDQAARPRAGNFERSDEHRADALGGIRALALRQHRGRADILHRQWFREWNRRDGLALVAVDNRTGERVGNARRRDDAPLARVVQAPDGVAVRRDQILRDRHRRRQHRREARRLEQYPDASIKAESFDWSRVRSVTSSTAPMCPATRPLRCFSGADRAETHVTARSC